jgi:hypothetical protein
LLFQECGRLELRTAIIKDALEHCVAKANQKFKSVEARDAWSNKEADKLRAFLRQVSQLHRKKDDAPAWFKALVQQGGGDVGGEAEDDEEAEEEENPEDDSDVEDSDMEEAADDDEDDEEDADDDVDQGKKKRRRLQTTPPAASVRPAPNDLTRRCTVSRRRTQHVC